MIHWAKIYRSSSAQRPGLCAPPFMGPPNSELENISLVSINVHTHWQQLLSKAELSFFNVSLISLPSYLCFIGWSGHLSSSQPFLLEPNKQVHPAGESATRLISFYLRWRCMVGRRSKLISLIFLTANHRSTSKHARAYFRSAAAWAFALFFNILQISLESWWIEGLIILPRFF